MPCDFQAADQRCHANFLESEYIALSTSMLDVLPLKDLTKAIVTSLQVKGIGLIKFKAMIQCKKIKTSTFNARLHEETMDA
jgi:hypothetical protein